MDTALMVFLCAISIVIIYGVSIFNNLIYLKNNVAKNWSNIDVLLKQRNNELPKLVDTCKQYMGFEQETLTKIVQARSEIILAQENQDVHALGNADLVMRANLGKLFALSENYPDLKTNQTFQQLQTRISALENDIADRREFYNESVNINNIRIEQFPDIIIARIFNFKSFSLLKFQADETKDVTIDTLFKK